VKKEKIAFLLQFCDDDRVFFKTFHFCYYFFKLFFEFFVFRLNLEARKFCLNNFSYFDVLKLILRFQLIMKIYRKIEKNIIKKISLYPSRFSKYFTYKMHRIFSDLWENSSSHRRFASEVMKDFVNIKHTIKTALIVECIYW